MQKTKKTNIKRICAGVVDFFVLYIQIIYKTVRNPFEKGLALIHYNLKNHATPSLRDSEWVGPC